MANTAPAASFWKLGIIMESMHKSDRLDGTFYVGGICSQRLR
jgi:hypothetical protein